MGAGALFHQTSLFRVCREANCSKRYRYGIGVRLDTDGSVVGYNYNNYYYYYYYYYSYPETLFYKLSGRMKTEGPIRIWAHNVGMEFRDLFGSKED